MANEPQRALLTRGKYRTFAPNFRALKQAETTAPFSLGAKLRDVAALFKLRLASLVVFSAVLGYLLGPEPVIWLNFTALCLGGFLLTGASNGLNQVWERNLDVFMDRTKDRPIPSGRMSVKEALIYSVLAGVAGLGVLFMVNSRCGILGALALFSYVFIYTPMKQRSSLAVFVGAFPGAIPPMLGYVAATNAFGVEAGSLFAVQFMWQFPHFWAIAWVAHDDYAKAGFRLLPFKEGRSRRTAFQILLYSLFLIPVSLLPWALPSVAPLVGDIAMVGAVLLGLGFAWFAWRLHVNQNDQAARALMFASFAYLPLIQILYVIDKT